MSGRSATQVVQHAVEVVVGAGIGAERRPRQPEGAAVLGFERDDEQGEQQEEKRRSMAESLRA